MRYLSPLWMLVAVVLALCLGLAGGYTLAPRYRMPAADGEARLRERAERFYRAGRLMDLWTMVRMYTPACQLAESEELGGRAAARATAVASFDEETLRNLERAAETVMGDALTVQLEGDWAVTSGVSSIFSEGRELSFHLDEVVWVRTGGDWWVYQLTPAELNAYGNPPDFARGLLATRPFDPEAMLGGGGQAVEEPGIQDGETPDAEEQVDAGAAGRDAADEESQGGD